MQINSKFPSPTSSRVLWWIKTILFLAVVFLLYQLIESKIQYFNEVEQHFSSLFLSQNIFLLVVIALLIPVNWGFEAWKWQKLASKIEKINFWEAYKAVLIGLTFSTATPMMIGDYAGKLLMLSTDKRLKSIGAILLGNSIQLYVSLLFGTISYIFFLILAKPNLLFLHITTIGFLIICLIFGIFLVLNLPNIDVFLSKNYFFEYLKKYLGVLENYTLTELKILFVIAISRYFVFSLQFVLMFKVFQINLPIAVLWVGVGIIFLTKTLISILNALGDLSIRELTSIYYFGFFEVDIIAVSSATFTIWLINVLLPIIIGSIFILQLKLTPKKQ